MKLTLGRLVVILIMLAVAAMAIAAHGQENDGEHEDDLEGANGAREEYIRRQKKEREESRTDVYGCPKEAPFICVTNAFTLSMECSCGGIGSGWGR